MDHEFQFPDVGPPERGTSYSFGVGVAAGAAIGLALGLLLAPKRGAALRREIVEGSKELGRKAADGSRRVRAAAGDLASKGRHVAEDAHDATAAALRTARRHAEPPLDAGEEDPFQGPLIAKQT